MKNERVHPTTHSKLLGILGIIICLFPTLYANLDTTTGANLNQALVLSTMYTFTDFELARGTVSFRQGFTLPSAGGTAFVGVNLPVSGVINLNGSTLVMQDDITLGSGGSIFDTGSGLINVNDFSIATGNQSLVWTGTLTLVNVSNFVLNANSTITAPWTFEGACDIEGNGYTLKLGPNGALIVAPGASLTLNNITIQGISGTKISCMDSTGTVSLGNVLWNQSADFTFGNGGFDVLGTWELVGTSSFVCRPARTCNIESLATIQLDKGMTFLYNPSSNNRKMLVFHDSSSVLALESATLASTSTGMILTHGSLITQGHCYLTQNRSALPALSESIQIGNGNPANEMMITLGSSSILDLLSGRLFYNQAQ